MFYKNTDNCRVLLIKTADNEDAGEGQTVEENENAKGVLILNNVIIFLFIQIQNPNQLKIST